MAFYTGKRQLCYERGILGVHLRAGLLQVRDAALWPKEFVSKNLTSVQMHYKNIERETLGILHGLEPLLLCSQHSVITDHKPLVATLRRM